MTHGEFQIGKDFWCGGQQWRCTDIGTRVIVAISVGAREVTELNVGVSGVDLTRFRGHVTVSM